MIDDETFITNVRTGKLSQKAKRIKKYFQMYYVLGTCFQCSGQQELWIQTYQLTYILPDLTHVDMKSQSRISFQMPLKLFLPHIPKLLTPFYFT